MVALFRIAPIEGGKILIDGVDISKIPLYSLRSKLGIVPQGTLTHAPCSFLHPSYIIL